MKRICFSATIGFRGAFAFVVLLILAGCATPTSTCRPAIPVSEVHLYRQVPPHSETVGHITYTWHREQYPDGHMPSPEEEQADVFARAAKMGANGVLFVNGHDEFQAPNGRVGYEHYYRTIYVPQQ